MSSVDNSFSVLQIAHKCLAEIVHEGDFCIDATAGRGNDTAFLAELCGRNGRVAAFDIQRDAVESTRSLLASKGLDADVYLDSHSNMDKYGFAKGSVTAITFNFGWLPCGNHSISTHADTSLEALDKSLELLKPGGVVSLCIYYGRDTGFAERDAILDYLDKLDNKKYTAIVNRFVNRPNCPPISAFIFKGV